jgi:hypothetical protein
MQDSINPPSPCQVPLTESLARVPKQARVFIEAREGCGTTSLPVGEFCHQAVDEIRRLGNIRDYLNQSRQRWHDKVASLELEVGRLTTECEYAKQHHPICPDPYTLGFYLYHNADGTEEYRIPQRVFYPTQDLPPRKKSCCTQPDIRADRPS